MTDDPLLWTVLRCAAWFVPAAHRAEWLADWHSELWYAVRSRRRGRLETLRFTLGAFNDAIWIWSRSANLSADVWLRSPRSCLTFLVGLAAVCVGLFYSEPFGHPALTALGPSRRVVLWMIVQTFCAFLILPAVTTMNRGRTFQASPSPACRMRARGRVFTSVEIGVGPGDYFLRSARVYTGISPTSRDSGGLRSRFAMGAPRLSDALPRLPAPAVTSPARG